MSYELRIENEKSAQRSAVSDQPSAVSYSFKRIPPKRRNDRVIKLKMKSEKMKKAVSGQLLAVSTQQEAFGGV